jgi:hypothetical protein
MYSWLLKYFNRPVANFLIFLWYFFLLLLIFYSADMQPGRFRYLRW